MLVLICRCEFIRTMGTPALTIGSNTVLPEIKLLDGFKKSSVNRGRGLIEAAKEAVSKLTPKEFMTVFPVEKQYNGDWYGVKDYFYTMEELKKIGMDTPIGEHVDTLLFDYQNPHVRKFNVFKFNVVDCFRVYEGTPTVMEAFLAEKGVSPMTFMTDKDGKQFICDRSRQTCYPVKKKRPRYLKIIKGGYQILGFS